MRTALVALVLAAACGCAEDWDEAMQQSKGLQMMHRLGLTREQLEPAVPIVKSMRAIYLQGVEADQQALAALAEDLEAQRERLLGGAAAADTETNTAQKAKEAQAARRQETLDDLNDKLSDFRKLLTPRQGAQIDWRNLSAGPENAREEQRRAMRNQALFRWSQATLERIRYFPLERYILEKEVLIDDFLRPLVRPFTPEYTRARAFMQQLVEQVRLTSEAQWPARRTYYANALMEGLNLTVPGKEAPETKYTRADLLAFLTAAETAELLSEMADATPAEDEGEAQAETGA